MVGNRQGGPDPAGLGPGVAASGIGWSALLVAAARAVESTRADGLVDDPWARRLVEAAGITPPMPTHPGQRWPDPQRLDDESTIVDEFWALMITVQGVRSRFIDEAVLRAARAGIAQVVVAGAGLDSRAFRLRWPHGVSLYEIDRPAIATYKDAVLAADRARPRVRRHVIPVDLADDWPSGLRAAGFAPDRPAVWIAEGLLPFLPSAVEAEFLGGITALAAGGSTLIVEDFGAVVAAMRRDPAVARFGVAFGVDMGAVPDHLLDRTPPEDALGALGWTVELTGAVDLSVRYERPMRAISTGLNLDTRLLTARR